MTATKTGHREAKGKTLALGLLVAVFMAACLMITARPAHAATFTVNSTGDQNDLDFPDGTFDGSSDGTCDVDSGTTGDQCTLRAAIQHANVTSGADEIHFSIPGTEVHTITPSSILPPITEAVTIDGYTQDSDTSDPSDDAKPNTLEQGNNAVLKIELDGTNAQPGLRIWAGFSTVKGLIINRSPGSGVTIAGSGANNNTVEGNFIGTDAAGTADLGNWAGVFIEAYSNTVGGTSPEARNIISGNDAFGVVIAFGGVTGNRVMGNYIGTDKDGDDDLGNSFDGVNLFGVSNNTVGGTEAGARNIISGNGRFGVILDSGVTSNRVEGNYIGTDAAGTIDLGNTDDGVHTRGGASGNSIGGKTAGAGNIISGNGGNGVEVSYYRDPNNPEDNDPTPATGNHILSNSIYGNDELGIDLATPPNELPPGVTANDGKDRDTGPNNRQNFPVITSATTDGTTTTITGKLNSRPRKNFTIQFFSSSVADPSGFGEGKEFLDEINVKTNRKGNRSFTFTVNQNLQGTFVTATATRLVPDPNDLATLLPTDTSEFSAAKQVIQAG